MLLAEDFSCFHYKQCLFYFAHVGFVASVVVAASLSLKHPEAYRRGEAIASQFIAQASAR